MKRNLLLGLVTFSMLVWFTSCSTSNRVGNQSSIDSESRSPNGDIINPEATVSFMDHLRKVPGVQVNGSGFNATVKIRGTSSIMSSSEPLIVVNGAAASGGIKEVAQTIPVDQIKRIKVLKNASETGMYGSRGGNGVIEITLK